MQSELAIRTAEHSDMQPLLELYHQLNPQDPVLAPQDACRIWRQFTHYPGSAILMGFKEKALVGSCTLVVGPNLTRGGAPYALIENVVTDAHHRNRGYGQAILKAAVTAAWECGCYKVMLLTGSNNPATLRFYQRRAEQDRISNATASWPSAVRLIQRSFQPLLRSQGIKAQPDRSAAARTMNVGARARRQW